MAKNELACTAGISITTGRLVFIWVIDGVAIGMGNCMVAARGVEDSTRGGAIKELADAWGDAGVETGGVEPAVDPRNEMVARSIKGSDVPDTSSRILDGKDKARMFSRGIDTSWISNFPNIDKIMQGWEGASRSTVVCTIASMRQGTPGKVRVLTWIL